LWRAEDQADNSPTAAQANARIEAVSDRIRIDTGDARQLPYNDRSFDAVQNLLPTSNSKAVVQKPRSWGP
jgi:arsenite methyltransferase